jgi:hypothetical protein
MNWHADRDTLDGYAAGRIAEAAAFSLEAHLLVCSQCRATLAGAVGRGRLDRIWAEVVDEVDRPRGRLVERLLARVGVPGHIARLLAAAPAVRLSWVLTVTAVLGAIAFAARETGGGSLFVLLVAPGVPVAGILRATERATDPLEAIGMASPIGGFRLMLIRTAAILLTSMALAAVAIQAFPGMGWTAVAWLLPSFMLTFLTLALSTKVSAYVAAATVTIAWGVAITAASVLLVIARREAFETGTLA